MLSDRAILYRLGLPPDDSGRLMISEIAPDRDIQAASVDVCLGPSLLVYTGAVMDSRRDNTAWWRAVETEVDRDGSRFWTLRRGSFYLGALRNHLTLPDDLAATLIGCSTTARLGLVLHQQAGHADPGYSGNLTLEITAVATETTIVTPGQRIGQLLFTELDGPCLRAYHGRYQGDTQPTPARTEPTGIAHAGVH